MIDSFERRKTRRRARTQHFIGVAPHAGSPGGSCGCATLAESHPRVRLGGGRQRTHIASSPGFDMSSERPHDAFAAAHFGRDIGISSRGARGGRELEASSDAAAAIEDACASASTRETAGARDSPSSAPNEADNRCVSEVTNPVGWRAKKARSAAMTQDPPSPTPASLSPPPGGICPRDAMSVTAIGAPLSTPAAKNAAATESSAWRSAASVAAGSTSLMSTTSAQCVGWSREGGKAKTWGKRAR